MRKKLLNNLGLKLASVVLAFILWFLVVSIEDPPDTKDYSNIQVKLINTELLEQEGKVYEILDNTDRVRVTVRAPKSIINQLRQTDIVAEADVGKLTDINTIALKYYVENVEVDNIEGSHEFVKLNVEEKASKWIRLVGNTVGKVADGYIISNTTVDQTNIEITGPKSVVSMVEYAAVDIHVTGAINNLTANIDIQLYGSDGRVIAPNKRANITKNVNYAYMTVEVLDTKEVPVKLEYMGVPEEGYMATGKVESDKSSVLIAGKTSVLENINVIAIPEERLNITGASGNMIDIVNVKEYLPSNVKLADKSFDGKITATVYIEPIVERELTIPTANIAFANVPEEFEVQIPEDEDGYKVTISGLAQHVDLIQQETIAGRIDVAEYMTEMGVEKLAEGAYNMPITYILSENVSIEEQETAYVRFIIPDEE